MSIDGVREQLALGKEKLTAGAKHLNNAHEAAKDVPNDLEEAAQLLGRVAVIMTRVQRNLTLKDVARIGALQEVETGRDIIRKALSGSDTAQSDDLFSVLNLLLADVEAARIRSDWHVGTSDAVSMFDYINETYLADPSARFHELVGATVGADAKLLDAAQRAAITEGMIDELPL